MPSKRLRSKRTISSTVTNLSSSVARVEQVSVPYQISPLSLSGDALDQDSVRTDAIAGGVVSSKSLGLSAYVPNGEGAQRVPAPLNDLEYWEDVTEGLIELHRSGIHDNEDIQNVSASTEGLVFSPTGVAVDPETGATGEARIYLTGRLPIPRSGQIYSTWKSTANIPMRLIWWTKTTPVKVSKASITSSTVTFTTSSAHGFSVGNSVKVTGCGSTFNGVYVVVSNVGTEGEATVFTAAALSTAPTDVNETVFAIDGLVSLEAHDYVNLENKVSWTAPDTAGEYAVYAELPYSSSQRTLTEAKVFEIIGSGREITVSANVNAYAITSNTITYTTDATHEFKVDDIVGIGYTPTESSTATAYQVSAGTPNVLTIQFSAAHKFHVGYEVLVGIASTIYNGTYSVVAVPNTTAINLATTQATTVNLATTGTVSAVTSPVMGQGKITATTSNTFSLVRTNVQNVSSTSITPTLAEVGRPRFSYITYASTNVAGSYIDVYTENPHGFAVGESVTLSGLPPATFPRADGQYTIGTVTDRYFRVTGATLELDVPITAVTAKQALAYVGSSDFSVEVGPDGFRFIGSGDSSVDTDLGTTSDNFISLSRVDGQSLASIDNQGVGTFKELVAQSATYDGEVAAATVNANQLNVTTSPTIETFDLVGELTGDKYNDNNYGYVEYSGALLDRMARGVVYKGTFNTGASFTVSTMYYSFAYGVMTLSPNRMYQIVASFGGLRATPPRDVVAELIFSTEPLQADVVGPRHLTSTVHASATTTEFTPLIGTFYTGANTTAATNVSISSIGRSGTSVSVTTATPHGLSAGDYVGISGTTNSLLHGTYLITSAGSSTFNYTTETTGTITTLTAGTVRKVSSLLSSAGVLPANLPIYWALRLRHGGTPASSYSITTTAAPSTTPQQEVCVVDIGSSRVVGGVDASALGSTSGMLTLGGGGAPPSSTTTYTTTATVAASSSAYYDNYGKGSGTTDAYAYKYSLYQGNPGTASGVKKSAVVFPTFAAPPVGATNVTVTKVEVYLRNRHSYNAGGLTAYIGVHSTSSLGTSIPSAPNGFTPVSSSFTKGQGKWVTLHSSCYSAFSPAAQTARGVLIGLTDDNPDTYYDGLSNYGYFDGNTMSDEPQLRITYTYDL